MPDNVTISEELSWSRAAENSSRVRAWSVLQRWPAFPQVSARGPRPVAVRTHRWSKPWCSTSDTKTMATARASQSSSFTASPTMFELGMEWCRPWSTPDTVCWFRTCGGYGPTRFRDPSAPRVAEQAAIGQDVIDFADALGLEQFALAGFDWGNRAACITSILHPTRVRAQVAVGGYSVQNTVTPSPPAPPENEARLWYQWYFNTERGRAGLEVNRRAICRFLWETWSPGWRFSDETFNRTAASFDNPEFVDVVIHSYRHRQFNAPGEERFIAVEKLLAERRPVQVPAIVLRGADTGFGRPVQDPSADRARFTSLIARRIIDGAGHDLPAQTPDAVSSALLELLA